MKKSNPMECIDRASAFKFKKYVLENGDYYKGSYNDRGLRHGSGHYLFQNGAQYIGTYRRGLKHGFGKMIFSDHSTYEGDWISNMMHGRGKYTYGNGDYYDGEWSMGKRHGLGTYYSASAQCTFLGVWQNGHRNGPGELKTSDYSFFSKWVGDRTADCGVFTLRSELMCSGFYKYHSADENGDLRSSSDWVTIQLNAYDATRLPQKPVDYMLRFGVPEPENVSKLRTVSEVDHATDYMIDRVFVKKDLISITDSLVENSFTVTEIRDITNSILKNVVANE